MNILRQIVEHKKKELASIDTSVINDLDLSQRSFMRALEGKDSISLIAEIKRRSPSNKNIFQGDFAVEQIARDFETSGASAISVLTDEHFFGGSWEFLRQAKMATTKIPILAKDFFIATEQILMAKKYGADAILLIAKILKSEELEYLLNYAESLGLDVLLEIADEEDLDKALSTKAKIIGINNRNLENFVVDLANTYRLAPLIPADRIIVSMSGFRGADMQLVRGFADAVLVGTAISGADDISRKIQEFINPHPLLKICGIRDLPIAEFCEKEGVDLVGLNFVPSSRRNIFLNLFPKNSDGKISFTEIDPDEQIALAKQIRACFKNTKVVGIFQNQSADFINQMSKAFDLDFVQIHDGDEPVDYHQVIRPIICGISIPREQDLVKIKQFKDSASLYLLDGAHPGSGFSFDHRLLSKVHIDKPYLVAGGINVDNALGVLQDFKPSGIDVASGAEIDGEIAQDKIVDLLSIIRSCRLRD